MIEYFSQILSIDAKPKNMINDGIGCLYDAVAHWRSNAGGVVHANSKLYKEMENDKSFHDFILEMQKILREKIENTDLDSYIKNASNSNRGLKCTAMGAYKLNIEYNHKVTIGVNYVTLHLYGEDLWDFKTSKDKGFWKNLKTEIIPGILAGKGAEFSISYDFKYIVEVQPNYYYIISSINFNYCLDIENSSENNEANLQIYKINYSDAQKFSFTKSGEYYYIVCKCSGKVIDVKYSGKSEGTNIFQYELNRSHAQQWKIKKGLFWTFYSRVNGLCLDLKYSETYNGNNIHCWSDNDSKAQKFFVTQNPLLLSLAVKSFI